LKCATTNETGKAYWSYEFIRLIRPGDILFHYATPSKAITAASIAGGPLEDRPITWTPKGTAGRSKRFDREPRPGWWLPLYGFRVLPSPLLLARLNQPEETKWIEDWVSANEVNGTLYTPIQRYPGALRSAQGYLTKMPCDWVNHWTELSSAVARRNAGFPRRVDQRHASE
jgi:hypothetical protein